MTFTANTTVLANVPNQSSGDASRLSQPDHSPQQTESSVGDEAESSAVDETDASVGDEAEVSAGDGTDALVGDEVEVSMVDEISQILLRLEPDILQAYHPVVQSLLPEGLKMRLPEAVLAVIESNPKATPEPPKIAVDPYLGDAGLLFQVELCDSNRQCTRGSFAVGRRSHPYVISDWQQHQARGYPITLGPNIQGFLLTKDFDGTSLADFSVMWEQENAVYRVKFPANNRQNILLMAHSMAMSEAISSGAEAVSNITSGLRADDSPADSNDDYDARSACLSLVDLHPIAANVVQWQLGDEAPRSPGLSNLDHSSDLNSDRFNQLDLNLVVPLPVLVPGFDDLRLAPNELALPELDDCRDIPFVNVTAVKVRQGGLDASGESQDPTLNCSGDNNEDNSPFVFPETKLEEIICKELKEQGIEPNADGVWQLTHRQLGMIARAITEEYVTAGYLTSRAVFHADEFNDETDNTAWIDIYEGNVTVLLQEWGSEDNEENLTNCDDPDERQQEVPGLGLQASYLCDRIERGIGPPMRSEELENQLRLLRFDPLFERVEAILKQSDPSSEPNSSSEPNQTNRGQIGQSILIVQIQMADPFDVQLSVDNYAPPNLGSERVGIQAAYQNLSGWGDTLAANYYRSRTGGLQSGSVSYSIPVNGRHGTLQVGARINRTEVTEPPFDILEIQGETEQYHISFRQPLTRTLEEEFALSWGFRFHEGQTFAFDNISTPFPLGPDTDGVSRTSVFSFGQEYIHRDRRGAWGIVSLFNLGVDVLGATTNDEPIPDGRFFSWQGQVQRLQHLGNPINSDHLLVLRLDTQLTPDSLLSSERFVMGGGQTLRGYRQNARSGDNGIRLSIEDRITLDRLGTGDPSLQLVPFIDAGAVWNSGENPNDLFEPTVLVGVGLGVIWSDVLGIDGLQLKVDVAVPLVPIDDGNNNNLQDEGVFFEMLYQP